jgi:hypothetical protein
VERNWLIRHAVRHPAKKGVKVALRLRRLAKSTPHMAYDETLENRVRQFFDAKHVNPNFMDAKRF